MVSHSYKRFLLAIAFAGSINSVAGIKTGVVYTQAAEGKYIFMNRMFKVEPKLTMPDEKRDITTRVIIGACAYLSAATIANADLTKNDINLNAVNKIVNSDVDMRFHLGVVAFATAVTSYYLNNYYYDDREEKLYGDNLVKFVANWDEYKAYTPDEFHDLFDELVTLDETTIRKRSLEVTKTVEDVLNHHFDEHTYRTSFKKKSSGGSYAGAFAQFLGFNGL